MTIYETDRLFTRLMDYSSDLALFQATFADWPTRPTTPPERVEVCYSLAEHNMDFTWPNENFQVLTLAIVKKVQDEEDDTVYNVDQTQPAIGFITSIVYPYEPSEIESVAIHPDHRGNGWFSQIMPAQLYWLFENARSKLVSIAVHSSTDNAARARQWLAKTFTKDEVAEKVWTQGLTKKRPIGNVVHYTLSLETWTAWRRAVEPQFYGDPEYSTLMDALPAVRVEPGEPPAIVTGIDEAPLDDTIGTVIPSPSEAAPDLPDTDEGRIVKEWIESGYQADPDTIKKRLLDLRGTTD